MKQIQVRTSEVARYTAKYIVNNGTDIATATAKGIELAALRSRLMNNRELVKICYRKKNGEIRVAIASLHPDICKSMISGNRLPKKVYGQFSYVELFPDGTLQWRSFIESNFIGTIED